MADMNGLSAKVRFAIACAVLGLLVSGPFLLTVTLILADAPPAERAELVHLISPRLPLGAMLTVLAYVLGVVVVRNLFKQYVRGLGAMAEHLRLMQSANRQLRVQEAGPPEVRDLARAANELADRRDALLDDVDQRIGEAQASLAEERNRLAALMTELSHAVVMCAIDGRILLYNNRARLQLSALAAEGGVLRGAALVGLGRSIFTLIDRGRIAHAIDSLRARLARGSADPTASFVTVTPGGQFLKVQLSPVRDKSASDNQFAAEMSGFVLSLENITLAHRRVMQRDQASREMLGQLSRSLTLLKTHAMSPVPQQLQGEIDSLDAYLGDAMTRLESAQSDDWPLEDIYGDDLFAALMQQIPERAAVLVKEEEIDRALWLHVDSFLIVRACCYLARRLEDDYGVREIRLRLTRDGEQPWAMLDLIWSGVVVSSEAIMGWELDPLPLSYGGAASADDSVSEVSSLREILARHGGSMRLNKERASHRAYLRLTVQAATPPEQIGAQATGSEATASSRPESYDFDLFAKHNEQASGVNLDARLTSLNFTVFDTETTGLDPSNGDEIIQIGAVRVLNGRLLRQEVIDQLVDPGIPIKPEGIPIHGISQDMVRGQPRLGVVLPEFHRFCADTVLVAHNAAFDMRFLALKEASLGVRFTQPVLDTLLLSAVIHPHQESHSLENICERLGVNVIGRHNALGDAFVTGEVFLKMIPLLADMGIITLRQALDAARKTYLARVSY